MNLFPSTNSSPKLQTPISKCLPDKHLQLDWVTGISMVNMFKRSLFGRLTPTSAQHLIFPASVNDAPSTQLLKPNPGLTLDSSFLYSSPSSFFSNLAGCSSKRCSESVLLLSHANVLWQEWVQPADGINGKKASRAGT